MMKVRIPHGLQSIADELIARKFQTYLVGGAVRDSLLGRAVKDYDIATDAAPEEVTQIFRRVIPTGIKHGTVTVLVGKHQYEVTTFRVEGKYSDARRPDSVTWTSSIDEDLKRRDFTINAVAYNLKTNTLHDPFGGSDDISKKIIRAIGNPEKRFKEDALRILRACRFVSQLNFAIEPSTLKAMRQNAPLIVHISAERIRDEIVKLFEAEQPSLGFESMRRGGLLEHILPELAVCIGVKQPDLHCFDVYTHSLFSCDAAQRGNIEARLAALLHDIGKPSTQALNEAGELCFYSHEKKGAELTRARLGRLRFPVRTIETVSHLVLCHMFNYDDSWKDASVRRFVKRVGLENLPALFALRRADQFGMCAKKVDSPALHEFEKRIKAVLLESTALSIKDLAVNGNDVMKELGLSEGRMIGLILEFLLESVLEDPAMNTRKNLLALAQGFYRDRLKV